ncbi:formin-like protein 13 isoform X2 [Mercurialis annua]|uniref:formin-like protein 13 isoform X2 n=1 Tax=Mercurialis annua TaxID=3986 RepID=UPI002160D9BF|nr:formin-like protein 13 isoform X2 [Mercurialis annua]
MALFRKLFYRKPPDGLLEICERVYVFDYCFITDAWQEENYRSYMSGIVGQLKEHFPDASFLAFNFREGDTPTQLANILSDFDMTIMEYPRQYEGCPLIKMELIHHFLRSGESWLSLGHNNLLLMHCERGGWLVLAFMLAALLIYRKQYSGEQKTLDMIYRQAPRELLHLLSPLNPLPSQLRYLQYVSRRNVASEWPPLDRTVTMDCIILRFIPNFDGHGGCCPVFRIYGHAPSDESANVGCLTPRKGKNIRAYKQTECELVKIDINCRIQGDVVLECVSLNDDMEHERMMFRAVFNTAFIRSNILILNRDEIDILWDAKDHFPKDFRAEILFSEMDAADSIVAVDFPRIEEKEGLTEEEFYKVHEMFNSDDWYSSDIALNVLQGASNILQEKLEADLQQGRQNSPLSPRSPQSLERSPRKRRERKKRTAFDSEIKSFMLSAQQIESVHSPKSSTDFNADIVEETKDKDIQSGLQVTIQSDKCERPHQLSLDSTTRLLSDNVASFGSPEFYDKISSTYTLNQNLPGDRTEPVDSSSVNFSPSKHPLGPVVNSSASNSLPPSISKTVDPLLAKETKTYIGDKCQLSSERSQPTSKNQSTMLVPPSPPIKLPIPPPLSPVGENDAIKCEPPTPPPPPTPPLKENLAVRVRPPPPPPPPLCSVQVASLTVSSLAPPPPPPPFNSSRAPSAPPPPSSAPPPPSFAPPTPAPPFSSPSSTKGRLSRTISSRSHQTKKLKPLHWLKLTRAVHGSLWEEAQKCGEASKAPEIDMSELETLFSASISSSDNGKKSNMRGSLGQKVDKVQLIEHRRAYNCEIMLSKVKVPLNTLMGSVLALEDTALDMDQLENLIKFCPTKEEMELLKGYTGEKEKLGKCEQFFLELMQVPRVESKLRVFSFKMQFHAQVSDLRNSLNVVNSTAEEIRNSAMLKKVMQTILSLGNALNQGTARGAR